MGAWATGATAICWGAKPSQPTSDTAATPAAQAPTKSSPQEARPAVVPLPSGTNDYLLAHQGFSPRVSLQGMAPYVRTVSERGQEARR